MKKVRIRFDFGSTIVRGKPGSYGHTFGGDIRYGGTVPAGCSAPVHLLYRLDLSDPALPFTVDSEFKFLPFFYAFSYDASPMSYRVLSDHEIEILGIETNVPVPDFPFLGYPQCFDSLPVKVVPVTYQEQRDITMAWYVYEHPEVYEAIPPDEIQRFQALGYPITRIGRIHDLLQRPRGEPCPNPACERHGYGYCLETIATIPEKPFNDLDLWQSNGSTIQIVYEICTLCGSIRTYNTCD
jgi:hypothetical protein